MIEGRRWKRREEKRREEKQGEFLVKSEKGNVKMLIRLPGEISYLIGFLLISLVFLVDWYECLMNSHELLARGDGYLLSQLGFKLYKPPFIPPWKGGHMLEKLPIIRPWEGGHNIGMTEHYKGSIR